MKLLAKKHPLREQSGSTFVETLVGTAIMGIMFASFFTAMSSGFSLVRVARENLRATQIILNRMEGLRLYNWNQLVYSNMIPEQFVETYYPLGTNGNNGIVYHGQMTITNAVLNPSSDYAAGAMRKVTVEVSWTSSGVERRREMSTYVSEFGIQNYLFNN